MQTGSIALLVEQQRQHDEIMDEAWMVLGKEGDRRQERQYVGRPNQEAIGEAWYAASIK